MFPSSSASTSRWNSLKCQSRFSQIHSISNSGNIAICVVSVNAKIDINGYKKNTFWGWILQWSSKFQMAQLKHKWQYWHSCIVASLWKHWIELPPWTVSGLAEVGFGNHTVENEITFSCYWPRRQGNVFNRVCLSMRGVRERRSLANDPLGHSGPNLPPLVGHGTPKPSPSPWTKAWQGIPISPHPHPQKKDETGKTRQEGRPQPWTPPREGRVRKEPAHCPLTGCTGQEGNYSSPWPRLGSLLHSERSNRDRVWSVLPHNVNARLSCLIFLPPAYVVPFTLLVCPLPISHNALQHFPECHGAVGGGYPARSSQGGYPGRGGYPGQGGYPAAGVPWSGTPPQPGQDGGVPWPGGYPARGVPWSGTPPARSGWGGTLAGGGTLLPCWGRGTQVGQQKEYSLHGGRYASCVHAGGLSCISLAFIRILLFFGTLKEHLLESHLNQNIQI